MKRLSLTIITALVCLFLTTTFVSADATQSTTLTPPDGVSGDKFGEAVAIDGDFAVIGASNHDDGVGQRGAAYVYRRENGTWGFQQKLTPPDTDGRLFGAEVAIDGDTIAIGAEWDNVFRGAVYIYTYNSNTETWSFQTKITGAAQGDNFGAAVALDNGTLAVGAFGEANSNGAVFIYTGAGNSWSPQGSKLAPQDTANSDYFGWSVDLKGDLLVSGAPQKGAAYTFTRSADVWTEQQKLTDVNNVDGFGHSVNIGTYGTDKTALVVSSHLDGENNGSVNLFTIDDQSGNWTSTYDTSTTFGGFGFDTAIDQDIFLVSYQNTVEINPVAVTPSGSGDVKTVFAGSGVEQVLATSGDTLVVGVPTQNNTGQVVVYGFDYTPPTFLADQSTPPDDFATLQTDWSNVSGKLRGEFNEPIQVGSGGIAIWRYDNDASVEAFTTTGDITLQGNAFEVTPQVTLEEDTTYYVTIGAGTFIDTAGNAFPGITDKDVWNFTTVDTTPKVASTSPADNEARVLLDTQITVNFTEPISNNSSAIYGEANCPSYSVPFDLAGSLDNVDTIIFDIPDPIEEEICTITLFANQIIDASNNQLDGNSDGTGGDDYTFSFTTINSNLIRNGKFNNPDLSDYIFIGSLSQSLTDGVLNLTRQSLDGVALVAQPVPQPITAGTGLAASVDLGNPTDEPINVTFRLYDVVGQAEELTCFFTVPANTAPHTYTLQGRTALNWDVIDVNLFVEMLGSIQVDNLNLHLAPDLTDPEVTCTAPKPMNKNLLANGDFGVHGDRFYFFLAPQIRDLFGGILEVTSQSTAGPALVAQPLRYPATAGDVYRVELDMSNPSNVEQQVTVRLFNAQRYFDTGESESIWCDFTVPANQTYRYTLGGQVQSDWEFIDMNILLSTPNVPLRIDNIFVKFERFATPSGDSQPLCYSSGTPPLETNLITNPSFNDGSNGYFFLGSTQYTTNGQLAITRTDSNDVALVAQPIPYRVEANSPLEMSVQLGNTSPYPKNVTFRLFDVVGGSENMTCQVTVPANTNLQTYTLRGRTSKAWDVIDMNIFVDDFGAESLTVDNINVRYRPIQNFNTVECITPGTPFDKNLVVNGDFRGGGWFHYLLGAVNFNFDGERLNLTRTNTNADALWAQPLRFGAGNGDTFEATVYLANPTTSDKTVTFRLFDIAGGSDKIECQFSVPAQTGYNPFIMRGRTTKAWDVIDVNLFVEDDNAPFLQVDGIDVQRKSLNISSSTVCENTSDNTGIQESATVTKFISSGFEGTDSYPPDWFGHSVDLDGDTAIIGAPAEGDDYPGAAYIFVRGSDGIWQQQAKLVPHDLEKYDHFGWSVAIDGDIAVVGAVTATNNVDYDGSVYIFKRENGVWYQKQKLLPPTTDDSILGFGHDIAIDGTTMVIGASMEGCCYTSNTASRGAAYVYRYDGSSWVYQGELIPQGETLTVGYGWDVDVSNNTIMVSDMAHKIDDIYNGAVFVFERNGSNWLQTQKLTTPSWLFGWSVSLLDDRVLIASRSNDIDGYAAYLYERVNGVWLKDVGFSVSSNQILGSAYLEYGTIIIISDDTLLYEEIAPDNWQVIRTFDVYLYGGIAVIDGNNLLLSDYYDDGKWENSGTAYLYDISGDRIQSPNLVTNGDFSNGENSYIYIGGMNRSVTNGVLNVTRTDLTQDALIAQPIGRAVTSGEVLQASVDLGNNTDQPKNVTLRLFDVAGGAEAFTCAFTVPANTPLQRYQLRGRAAGNWQLIDFNLYVEDFNQPHLLVDNVDVRVYQSSVIVGTPCTPPDTLPQNTNLLVNGDFAGGGAVHLLLGALNWNVTNGILNITRTDPNVGSLLAQPLRFTDVPAGSPMRASVQLGNPTSQTKTVTLRLFDVVGGSANLTCGFIVAPNTPLQTYSLEGIIAEGWQVVDVNLFIEDNNAPFLQVDNLSVVHDPSITVNGCFNAAVVATTALDVATEEAVVIEAVVIGAEEEAQIVEGAAVEIEADVTEEPVITVTPNPMYDARRED